MHTVRIPTAPPGAVSPRRSLVSLLGLLASALVLFGSAAPIQAQAGDDFRMRTGVGWMVVLPDALLGLGAFHVFDRLNVGLFIDGKMTHGSVRSDPNFQSGQTIAGLEELYASEPWRIDPVGTSEEWLFLNAGLVRPITSHLGIMVGGGMARRSVIREYVDHSEDPITPSGFYYVEDETLSEWGPNAELGALIRGGDRVSFSVGFETAPKSFSLGLFLILQ